MTENTPLRVAIIGAGPSGFYAAEALLKRLDDVLIDLIDRLPTPYGLVRYGVAPDHQKIKSVTRMYERTSQDERIRFFGNVEFGKDLSLSDVKRFYHAVIYTVGASSDRSLGIPGEALPNSLSATEFVAWYNGHPDYTHRDIQLESEGVAVIGMGNVAVDVTRILAKSVEELAETDIADHALKNLAKSKVQDIYMLGRRGPAQAKFTTKELRELGELANADIVIDEQDLALDEYSLNSLEGNPGLKKNVEILKAFAQKPLEGKPRRVHIKFFVSPKEIKGEQGISELELEKNHLEVRGDYLAAVGTGTYESLPVGMVLRSVGYKGSALSGVSFDKNRGVIPNNEGRVLDAPEGEVIAGEYVAGWIKRGPTGVIGTNKADAVETVTKLVEDVSAIKARVVPNPQPEAVTEFFRQSKVQVVSFSDWQVLNEHELECGKEQGRPRVKVTAKEKMLEVCLS